MEVQSPQSVQINFNNKIITLHNVTIVKNPKIITINAAQYPNLLKGQQIKLPAVNGTATASPDAQNSAAPIAGNVKSPQTISTAQTIKSAQLSNAIPIKNGTPISANAFKTIPKLGVLQLKSPFGGANTFKLQSMPIVKSPQSQIVVSPPKPSVTLNNGTATPMKVQLKPFQANSFVISKPPQQQQSPIVSAAPQAKIIISPPQKHKLETSPTPAGQPDAKKVCKYLPFCCIICKDAYDDSDALIEHMKCAHPDTMKIPPKVDSIPAPVLNGNLLTPKLAGGKPILMSNLKFTNMRTIDASGQSRIILKSPQGATSTPKIIISPNMLDNSKLKPVVKTTVEKSPSPVKSIVKMDTEPVPQIKVEASPTVQTVKLSPAPVSPLAEVQPPPVKEKTTEKAPSVVEQIVNDKEPSSQPNPPTEKIRKKPGRKPKYPDGMKPVKIKRAYNKTGKYSKLNPPPPPPPADPNVPPPPPKKRGRKPKSLLNGISPSSPAMKKIQKTIPESMKYLVPQSMSMQHQNAISKNAMNGLHKNFTSESSVDSRTTDQHDTQKSPKKEQQSSNSNDDSSDSESEVQDLLRDAEDERDSQSQCSSRSSSPESPEFEEVYPTAASSMRDENDENDFDYDEFEYCSNIMEPICELSCEDDSGEENRHDENDEAMRLYREAMEMNYQANGIKKRGRRRKKVKPLMENFNEINGILAGLLEDSGFKVPKGPGRGRRKEMNELELTMERINGTCLFSCNKCDETFKYAGDLAKHVRSHTINSPYQCTICQRKFTHIGSLNTHLRIHSGERPYKCNQCDKSFTQSNSLMVHVKSHLSNKPFQCLQCNKGFLNASSLALHQKTHAEPTAVICPIDNCGKEFRDSNLLEEHMQTHKQSLLYQCSLCSEKFENSALLVQHVKTHIGDKPFQCNQCFKCFTQPGSLNTHLRIHTGEKPFKCEVCGKSFTQASSLSVHMKVHGEKEFKCLMDNCNRSFGQEVYLKKHMLKHIENSMSDDSSAQLSSNE